jgi:hypothetical protein
VQPREQNYPGFAFRWRQKGGAAASAQGCNVYTQYPLLTWLPSYLQQERHLLLEKSV